MSIELTTRNIGSMDVNYDNFVEQGIDCDVTLPDYCPDIMRILKCSIQNNITNSKISGDRATADGTSFIRIIYSDDKDKIFCYEQEYPFSKFAELPTIYDNAVLNTSVKTDYVNCRAVSKRRIDIHGVISIRFKVIGTKNDTIISDASGSGVQMKRKGIDIADTISATSKNFSLSEVESIPDSNTGIGKVLDINAAPIVNETKIIKGKILLKGELTIKVLYASDSEDNETETADYNIPFNEIVEVDSVTDDCFLNVNTNVNQITVEPKGDNDGEYRFFNINAEISAEIVTYCTKSISVVTDAYSTQADIDTKYTSMALKKLSQNIKDSFVCNETIDIASFNPAKIYSVTTGKPEVKSHFSENKLTISGKIPVGIIIIDSDSVASFCEREAEFEYVHSLEDSSENLFCISSAIISGFSCRLSPDAKAEFKAEICINATVFKNVNERVMTSLQISETQSERKNNPSLTIYFCSGGESVWDIARKYNTTVEEIMEENHLTADYLENKEMLMIPVK